MANEACLGQKQARPHIAMTRVASLVVGKGEPHQRSPLASWPEEGGRRKKGKKREKKRITNSKDIILLKKIIHISVSQIGQKKMFRTELEKL